MAAALLTFGLLPAASAAAATYPHAAPQRVSAVSTSRSAIALKWEPVPGAVKYKVSYSTSSTMKKAKSKTTTKPSLDLTKLKAKKTYYVTVRVISAGGKAQSPVSKKLKVKTRSKSSAYSYLAPAGLTVTKVSADSASLKWASRGKGLRYRVAVSTSASFAEASYVYVNGTSTTIRNLIDGAAYHVRVRVVSKTINAILGDESTPAQFSTPGLRVTGGPATVTVASYNVGSQSKKEGGSWADRRSAVVSTVLSQRPDVIGFQEASQGKLGSKDLSQAEDLVNRLGKPYALANTARYNCKNPTSPHKCVAQYQGAANSQKIAYNTQTLTLLQQGSKKTDSAKTKMTEHRYVEWAIFRHKATGKKFLFVNVHLDPGTTSKARAMREKQLKQILGLIEAKNSIQLPTYVVGDFNSHKWTEPANVPYDMMVRAGYVDPLGNSYRSMKEAPGAIVQKRINTVYSSINKWERAAPANPDWVNGTYIDYIWTSAGIEVPEWETVVKIDKSGKLVGRIPSDHNMLRATTVLH
ncbi:MAG: fibronectin type III domain-containing protein [Propionicimonas sp.]